MDEPLVHILPVTLLFTLEARYSAEPIHDFGRFPSCEPQDAHRFYVTCLGFLPSISSQTTASDKALLIALPRALCRNSARALSHLSAHQHTHVFKCVQYCRCVFLVTCNLSLTLLGPVPTSMLLHTTARYASTSVNICMTICS